MPRINLDRLLSDLQTLRTFGATGNGVVRTTYSQIDMDSRHWLAGKFSQAGLRTEIDGVGNVIGESSRPGKRVLVGSHTDTQPSGGWLDGALGVIYGLEVVRALAECHDTRHLAVDVASWADEESSYLGMIGSRSFCGLLKESEIINAVGRDGRPLVEALRVHGLLDLPRARFDRQDYIAYLEAHIEQGPLLELQGRQIGVVTAIVGMLDFEIVFTGQQNHAGTTPMSLRRDAGMALIRFAHDLTTEVTALAGEKTVWTVGNVTFEPGAPSIIPGIARMLWQFRDPEESRLEKIRQFTEQKVRAFSADNEVQVSLELRDDTARAVGMDPGLQEKLALSAQAHCPDKWVYMPSGAAHDAQTLATRMPSAMLFIPSIDGISHSFDEDSRDQDIVLGCQVLTDAVAAILHDSAVGL